MESSPGSMQPTSQDRIIEAASLSRAETATGARVQSQDTLVGLCPSAWSTRLSLPSSKQLKEPRSPVPPARPHMRPCPPPKVRNRRGLRVHSGSAQVRLQARVASCVGSSREMVSQVRRRFGRRRRETKLPIQMGLVAFAGAIFVFVAFVNARLQDGADEEQRLLDFQLSSRRRLESGSGGIGLRWDPWFSVDDMRKGGVLIHCLARGGH
uniref:Uncharacterized protein n=1 Tax=Haptolina ericina TaxID=156174 RepID=A0A7S3ARM2_9EUKA|mmetsp:Transcript_28281/g.64034  ORF Transcript_28281/g.64034 Transcript_28281/m.64034 type:complete len:210 (+) Transcript_28281:306-935(+)